MYKRIGILALILSSSLYADELGKKENFAVKLNESTINQKDMMKLLLLKQLKMSLLLQEMRLKKEDTKM